MRQVLFKGYNTTSNLKLAFRTVETPALAPMDLLLWCPTPRPCQSIKLGSPKIDRLLASLPEIKINYFNAVFFGLLIRQQNQHFLLSPKK
jgi:hypothetical protein